MTEGEARKEAEVVLFMVATPDAIQDYRVQCRQSGIDPPFRFYSKADENAATVDAEDEANTSEDGVAFIYRATVIRHVPPREGKWISLANGNGHAGGNGS